MNECPKISIKPIFLFGCICLLFGCSDSSSPVKAKGSVSNGRVSQSAPAAAGNPKSEAQLIASTAPASTASENQPPEIEEIIFKPSPPATGDEVHASVKTDNQSEEITTHFVWKVNGDIVQDSNEEVLQHSVKAGDLIEIEARACNAFGEGNAAMHSIYVTNAAPNLRLVDEGIEENAYRARLEASDPEGDPIKFSLKEAPAGLTLDPEKGLIRWPLTADIQGDFAVKMAASDSQGAETTIAYRIKIKWETLDKKEGQRIDGNSTKQ